MAAEKTKKTEEVKTESKTTENSKGESKKLSGSTARDHAQLRRAQAEAAKLGVEKAKEEMKNDQLETAKNKEEIAEIAEEKLQVEKIREEIKADGNDAKKVKEEGKAEKPKKTVDVEITEAKTEPYTKNGIVHVTEELPVYLL